MNLKYSLAEKMIEKTELSIAEICDDCGFGEYANFMHDFRKRYGVTPGQYRRNIKVKDT
jgi:AraC family transcriptional regulator of arabinose operon